MAYQTFAQVYDRLMEGAPYDDWVTFTQQQLEKYLSTAKTIIDLGCGTGEIAIRLAEKGYSLTGVDLSTEMLVIANEKSITKKLPLLWVNQDIKQLEVAEKYDVAISFCDVMNYITDEAEVEATFSRIYEALNKDGLFIFDVHSQHYLQQFLANQTFADVHDDLSYIWFCEEGEYESSVEHFLTFFIKDNSDRYQRFDEFHIQRTFPILSYKRFLTDIGFTILGVYSDFSIDHLDEEGDRIFFVCQKIEEA